MKVAVIGATGLVGRKMLQVLQERKFPIRELVPVASDFSVGKVVKFNETYYEVISIEQALEKDLDFVLMSAGAQVSKKYAKLFAQKGAYVIDNSSAWRLDPQIKLIVPEVNGDLITKEDHLIANPNCSTIQMVVALAPLHKAFGIKRIVVSTYQSVTGAGHRALEQLVYERAGVPVEKVFPYQIDLNILPHCDIFLDNGYTKEEMKLVNETHKILDDANIQISATAARVPVYGGHSESINVEFYKDFTIEQVRHILASSPGIVLMDNPRANQYPMPIVAYDRDEVFVGRLRPDLYVKKALNMWVVADNLRKGAATNAVQIAQIILNRFFK